MLRASLDGRGFGERMDACFCMAEFLYCSPETITTLLIGYTPKQNVFGIKKILKTFFKGQNKKNGVVKLDSYMQKHQTERTFSHHMQKFKMN